ncbi:MAG: hypothetical protein Q7J57_00505 [Gemmobacter sp.]|nr:hypothetical protein [Gemmobacter sp.]
MVRSGLILLGVTLVVASLATLIPGEAIAGDPALTITDLGMSIRQRVPIADLIMERIPATAKLAFLFVLVNAVPLGLVTAVQRGTRVDYSGTVVAVLGVSTPGFLWR